MARTTHVTGFGRYLALESVNGLRRRVKAYQHFHSIHELPFFDIAEPVALLDSVDVQRVLSAIAEARIKVPSAPALIVVDTMHGQCGRRRERR